MHQEDVAAEKTTATTKTTEDLVRESALSNEGKLVAIEVSHDGPVPYYQIGGKHVPKLPPDLKYYDGMFPDKFFKKKLQDEFLLIASLILYLRDRVRPDIGSFKIDVKIDNKTRGLDEYECVDWLRGIKREDKAKLPLTERDMFILFGVRPADLKPLYRVGAIGKWQVELKDESCGDQSRQSGCPAHTRREMVIYLTPAAVAYLKNLKEGKNEAI